MTASIPGLPLLRGALKARARNPAWPFDERQVVEKFRRLVGSDEGQTQRLLATCRAVFDSGGSAAALVGEIARAIG